MRVAVIVFPGSNCDRDAAAAVDEVLGAGTAELVWHEAGTLDGFDAAILPGGFSYGDYLRCGAMARLSPVMSALRAAADDGLPVLGICNGFQILCEAGLLPGALLRNDHLRFRCDTVPLDVASTGSAWSAGLRTGARIHLPIAHGEGRYHADAETLDELERAGRVVLRYAAQSPNGSARAIAGISNERGNVVGMMPHPERAIHAWMPSTDGRAIIGSVAHAPAAAPAPHREVARAGIHA